MYITRGLYYSLAGVVICALIGQAHATTIEYKIEPKSASVIVHGTSTLHDWSMVSHQFTGNAAFEIDSGRIVSLTELNVIIPVQNLKSDYSDMDQNAYKALKSDAFPQIAFTLADADLFPKAANADSIVATGYLIVAGVSRPATLDALVRMNRDGSISTTGSTTLRMSDFNIKPPSFMLGAMRAGNTVTLEFSVRMVR